MGFFGRLFTQLRINFKRIRQALSYNANAFVNTNDTNTNYYASDNDNTYTNNTNNVNTENYNYNDNDNTDNYSNDTDDFETSRRQEDLKEIELENKNNLVSFNAMIANAVRYPNKTEDKQALNDLLTEPVKNREDLTKHLLEISRYEFGTDGKSGEADAAFGAISMTLDDYVDDNTRSVADLFNKVNQENDVADLSYIDEGSYYQKGTVEDVNNAAAFVHNGDTLDDVINRSHEVFKDVDKDTGVNHDDFTHFSDIEDAITDNLDFSDDEDFFNDYKNFYTPQFHSNDDVFNALKDKNIDVDDEDLHRFVDFAMKETTDVTKKSGLSMNDVMKSYDSNRQDYLEDTLSNVQSRARADDGASLTSKYEYLLKEGVADRVSDRQVKHNLRNDKEFRDHYVRMQTRDGVAQDTMAGKDVSLYATNIHAFNDSNNKPMLSMDVKKRDDVDNEHSKFDGQYVTNRDGNHPHTQYLNEAQAKKFFAATSSLVDFDQFSESMEAAAANHHQFNDVPFNADVKSRKNKDNVYDYHFDANTIEPAQEYYDGADISDIAPKDVEPFTPKPVEPEVVNENPTPKETTTAKAKDVEDELEP